jgi:putative transposase
MSFVKIWVHAVWGTKNRIQLLKQPVLNQFITHIVENAKEKKIYIDSINGNDDHLHILMLLNPEYSISKQIQLLKGESAHWANKQNVMMGKFEWADKYFASSVSEDKIQYVREYLQNQQEHHKKFSFAEEYKRFLEGIGYFGDLG